MDVQTRVGMPTADFIRQYEAAPCAPVAVDGGAGLPGFAPALAVLFA